MVVDPTNSTYCPDMNTIENWLLKINHEKKLISKDSFKKHTTYKQLHVYQTYSYNISSNSKPQLLHKALQSYIRIWKLPWKLIMLILIMLFFGPDSSGTHL